MSQLTTPTTLHPHTLTKRVHVCLHVYGHTCMFVPIDMYTLLIHIRIPTPSCSQSHTHSHTHTHTHSHTHIHTHALSQNPCQDGPRVASPSPQMLADSVEKVSTIDIIHLNTPVFAPAEMNWASRRMYNTHKRAILYVLYGLILGVCGTPKHPMVPAR